MEGFTALLIFISIFLLILIDQKEIRLSLGLPLTSFLLILVFIVNFITYLGSFK